MQLKIERCYFTPIRMAIKLLARMWRNCSLCALLVGMSNGAAMVENSLVIPHKVKHRINHVIQQFYLRVYTQKNCKSRGLKR